MLLFGKRPQRFLISSAVKCAHFHGTRVGKPIPSHQVYQGTVFELVDHAVDFVLGKIALSVGTRAQSVQALVAYEIPREVVTEAIVNAVAHRDSLGGAGVSPVGAAAAGSVGEREIRTQRRVVAFFRDVLGYAYLGDWRDRAGNANVETTLLIGWLRRQGHDDRIPGQVAANHPSSSVWRAPEAIALRIARIPAATSSRAVWPTSTLTQRTSPAAFSSSRSPAARTSLTRSSRCRPTGPARAGTRRG